MLLPITLDDFSLDWALYSGRDDLADARFGLLEPTGPRLGPDAIGTADIVVIPALAIDADGRRLGQGAGCYDRALPHVAQSDAGAGRRLRRRTCQRTAARRSRTTAASTGSFRRREGQRVFSRQRVRRPW